MQELMAATEQLEESRSQGSIRQTPNCTGVVAVAMQYDAPMYVVNYAQTRKLPFKVAMDDGSAAKQFGNVQMTPTTFVVDKNGTILKRYVGEPQFAELDRLLQKALGSA